MAAYDNLAIQYYYLGELEKSKYYNDRICRGKFESNFSIVKKMSQTHVAKKVDQDRRGKSTDSFGVISNIEQTISSLWLKNQPVSQMTSTQIQEALKS